MARNHPRFSSTVPYELKDGNFVSYIEELHRLALQKRLATTPQSDAAPSAGFKSTSYESPQDSFAKIRSQHQKTMDALHHSAQQRKSARASAFPSGTQPYQSTASTQTPNHACTSIFNQSTRASTSPAKAATQAMTMRPPLNATKRRAIEQQIRKLNSMKGAMSVFSIFTLILLLTADLYFPGNLIVLFAFILALCGFTYALVKGKILRSEIS